LYELGEIQAAIENWEKVIQINNKSSGSQLAIAVALYHQGNIDQGLQLAESALKLDSNIGKLDVLKNKWFWGDKLLADAEKLLKTPRIQAFLSQNR
jgi:hypothetical protein